MLVRLCGPVPKEPPHSEADGGGHEKTSQDLTGECDHHPFVSSTQLYPPVPLKVGSSTPISAGLSGAIADGGQLLRDPMCGQICRTASARRRLRSLL